MSDNAYEKGYQAYLDGQDLEDNPFEENTDSYADWEGGWVAASDNDSREEE